MNTIDKEQATEFLEALTGKRNPCATFQTFGDNQENRSRCAAIHPHGQLSGDVYKSLRYRHGKGSGVFVMVNEGDGKGRKGENVIKVRALFLDTDGVPMEPARDALKPHIIVESSPGKYHLYWLVSDCPLDRFSPLQKAIAARFGGDSSVHDLPRVMRVPGFWHQKGTPVMTQLISAERFPPYTVAELVEHLGLTLEPAIKKEPGRTITGPLPIAMGSDTCEVVDPATGESIDLRDWVVKHPDFKLATALKEYAPHVVRGESHDGKQHIECPFSNQHTNQGEDLATFVTDGGKGGKAKGFTVKCMHDHCVDRDRLDFIREMLLKGLLPLSALTDSTLMVDDRRPIFMTYPGADLQKHPGFALLNPDEKAKYLFLFFHCGCFIEVGGTVPDSDRAVCRYLDVSPDRWKELREIFIEVGLCRVEGDRLVSDMCRVEFSKAKVAYNKKIRAGRKGGSSYKEEAHA